LKVSFGWQDQGRIWLSSISHSIFELASVARYYHLLSEFVK